MDDDNSKKIEKIKNILIDLIQNRNNDINIRISDYLKEKLHQDYSKISNLFSEIANLLHYSSSAHLSNQFKKVIGFSPSYFKKMKGNK